MYGWKTYQTGKNTCLPYYTSGIKWNSGKMHTYRRTHAHTHTHTPHSDVRRHHLISAFIESVVSPFRDLGEGAFHCACQSPPSSTDIWNHNADSVTSKYLWWLPRSPLSHPFLGQECFSPSSIDTAWLMLKNPAFLLDNLSFSRQE